MTTTRAVNTPSLHKTTQPRPNSISEHSDNPAALIGYTNPDSIEALAFHLYAALKHPLIPTLLYNETADRIVGFISDADHDPPAVIAQFTRRRERAVHAAPMSAMQVGGMA